jgi:hypothetical protein
MGKALQHAAMALPRGYLFGLTLSTAGSSATFTTAAGEAVDDTFVDLMTLGSSLAKTTSAWAVGAAAGSLDTGAIANSTWYHVYLIKRVDTGVVDVLTSLSATSPTMPTNYTIKRRIGSMKTNGSSQWTLFSQLGDEFLWDAQASDVVGVTLGTTATLYTLSVPPGIQVTARLTPDIFIGTANIAGVTISSPDSAVVGLGSGRISCGTLAGGATSNRVFGEVYVRTNTSQQVRAQAYTAASTFSMNTIGWIDTRGKLY